MAERTRAPIAAAAGDGEAPPRDPVTETVRRVAETAAEQRDRYAGGEEHPLGSYVALMATYAASVVALGAVTWLRRRRLPERFGAADLALGAVATHKLARLLSRDPVTAPLRAPFVTFKESAPPAEVNEEVRGRGARKAVGELVTCPFCLDQWVGTAMVFGFLNAPRLARAAASTLTIVAAADVLQLGYAGARNRVE